MALPDFATLIRDLLDHNPASEETPTDSRILDATLWLVGEYGERRLTIDDVAAASRAARSTIFRRFGSRDALLARLYQREVRMATETVFAAASDAPDARSAIVAGYGCLVDHVAAHPVTRRITRAEPEIMVGLWRDGDPPGLEMIRAVLTALVRERDDTTQIDRESVTALSDALARLMFAELLIPSAGTGGFDGHARDALVGQLVDALLSVTRERSRQ